jgi:hypothetical protein
MQMVKKLFALASVTALAGVVMSVAAAGCSSTTQVIDNGDATADAGKVAVNAACKAATECSTGVCTAGKCAPKADAAPPVGADEEAPVSTVCKGTIAVDPTTLPWKSPYVEKGACTQKELNDLSAAVTANKKVSYADLKKTVTNAGCASCMFGKESDAKWRPLVENASGQLTVLNVGGCIAIASNNDACGKAYQNWRDCGYAACDDCPQGDQNALSACVKLANKGVCKGELDAIISTCTEQGVTDAETACDSTTYVFEGPIRGQCIGLAEGGE